MCVNDLIAVQAANTPHAIALVAGARRITYAQLNESANRLAHFSAQKELGQMSSPVFA